MEPSLQQSRPEKRSFALVIARLFVRLSQKLVVAMGEGVLESEEVKGERGDLTLQKFCFPDLYFCPSVAGEYSRETAPGGESRRQKGSLVSVHDTWMCALKVLVNLTHACEVNCRIIGRDKGVCVIETAVEVLGVLLAHREAVAATEPSASSPVSRGKRRLDKFANDANLFLLTLLCNLVELRVVGDKETEARAGLQSGTDAEEATGNAVGHVLDGVDLQEEHEKGSRLRCARSLSCTTGGVNLMSFLVHCFIRETRHMVQDFQAIPATSAPPCSDVSPTRRISSGCGSSSAAADESGAPLPLDEIVLSTHLALLLHAVHMHITPQTPESPFASVGPGANTGVRSLLPGGSWWLPVRVLQAYLSLQDQVSELVM